MYSLHTYQQELVDQARNAFITNRGVMIQSPPGSGKSVMIAEIAKLTTDKGNHVLFIVHRNELVNQIKESFAYHGVPSELTTVMTVGRVANRLGQLPKPSLIITDETHHSKAATYKKIYDYYSDVKLLGFTATPWRLSGTGFTDIYSEMVKGPQVNWLINQHFLAPFDYYAPVLADVKQLKTSSNGEYSKKSMDSAFQKAIYGDVVSHYQKLANNRKTILYAHSIEASKAFAKEFNQAGIKAIHVDSKTPKAQRDQIMEDFKKGEIKILCNVDLVSEGFNVPDCSCVILLRPTASLVLYLQQSMRSMRYQPNKTAIIIDHVGNYLNHGLPNTPREWTLEGREKKSVKGPGLTSCPHCFAVIPSRTNLCPYCGIEIATELSDRDNELEKVGGELQKISFDTDYRKIKLLRKYSKNNYHHLKTVEDFYCYAKIHGYKLGWIKYQVPSLKHLKPWELNTVLKVYKEKYQEIL